MIYHILSTFPTLLSKWLYIFCLSNWWFPHIRLIQALFLVFGDFSLCQCKQMVSTFALKKQRTPQNSLTKFKNQRAHDRLELHNGTNGIVLAKKKRETIAGPKLSKIMATGAASTNQSPKLRYRKNVSNIYSQVKWCRPTCAPLTGCRHKTWKPTKINTKPVVCCAMCYKTISLISSPSPVFRFFSFVVSGPQRVVSYDHWCAPQDISGNMLPSAVVQVPLGQIE